MTEFKKYTFTELSSVLMNIYYNYDEIPEFVRQTAEYFQYLEELAVTSVITEEKDNYDKLKN